MADHHFKIGIPTINGPCSSSQTLSLPVSLSHDQALVGWAALGASLGAGVLAGE